MGKNGQGPGYAKRTRWPRGLFAYPGPWAKKILSNFSFLFKKPLTTILLLLFNKPNFIYLGLHQSQQKQFSINLWLFE